jgi:hypothetical protein
MERTDLDRMDAHEVPVVRLVCGIGNGRNRTCGRVIGEIGIDDDGGMMNIEDGYTDAQHPEVQIVATCPQHGLLVVAESVIRSAPMTSKKSKRGSPPIVQATSRLPVRIIKRIKHPRTDLEDSPRGRRLRDPRALS